MKGQMELKKIEEAIDQKKVLLNNLAKESLGSENIVNLSKEIDILINKYYKLKLRKV